MNGREGGSSLTGQQLMSLWDTLCQHLNAREVSVEDVSNKSGMLLRIMHATAFGRTWWVPYFAVGSVREAQPNVLAALRGD